MFSVFNIMTGIVVEKALVAARPDRDEIILEHRRKATLYWHVATCAKSLTLTIN